MRDCIESMRHSSRRGSAHGLSIFLIILSVSLTLTYYYMFQTVIYNVDVVMDEHNAIVSGSALSPYRYRILVPYILDPMIDLAGRMMPESIVSSSTVLSGAELSFIGVYGTFYFLGILGFLTPLFFYLRRWFGLKESLIGFLFSTTVMTMALRDHAYAPYSILEPALFTIALILITKNKELSLIPLTFIATLTKETSFIIPAAYFMTKIDFKSLMGGKIRSQLNPILWSFILSMTWLLTFIGLRFFLGSAEHIFTVGEIWTVNTRGLNPVRIIANISLMFGAFWIFSFLGFKNSPEFIRKTAAVVPIYLIPWSIWSVLYEVRLLMFLYPIIIPLGMFYMFKKRS